MFAPKISRLLLVSWKCIYSHTHCKVIGARLSSLFVADIAGGGMGDGAAHFGSGERGRCSEWQHAGAGTKSMARPPCASKHGVRVTTYGCSVLELLPLSAGGWLERQLARTQLTVHVDSVAPSHCLSSLIPPRTPPCCHPSLPPITIIARGGSQLSMMGR